MEWLTTHGCIAAIWSIICVLCTATGLFLGRTTLFDSITIGIAIGFCCNQFLDLHIVLCLIIGIVVFILLFLLKNTRCGFWLSGLVVALVYAAAAGVFVYITSSGDPVLACAVFGVTFLLLEELHRKAKWNAEAKANRENER